MTDPTRAVLRDALLDEGALAPEATEHDLLRAAVEAQHSPDAATAELAAEVVERAPSRDLLRTMFPQRR